MISIRAERASRHHALNPGMILWGVWRDGRKDIRAEAQVFDSLAGSRKRFCFSSLKRVVDWCIASWSMSRAGRRRMDTLIGLLEARDDGMMSTRSGDEDAPVKRQMPLQNKAVEVW